VLEGLAIQRVFGAVYEPPQARREIDRPALLGEATRISDVSGGRDGQSDSSSAR